MSKRTDKESLEDIIEAIHRISLYVKNLSYQKFSVDIKSQDAVIRNLEIIGEAVKNLSKELRTKHRDINWSNLAKLRDKLIHHYHGVNLDILWTIIDVSLPEIFKEIKKILNVGSPHNPKHLKN